jgi:hypothetical protein
MAEACGYRDHSESVNAIDCFVLSFLESTKSVNVLTCALKTSISDCQEAEAEAEGFSCFVTISV